jgi:hypothetical protein
MTLLIEPVHRRGGATGRAAVLYGRDGDSLDLGSACAIGLYSRCGLDLRHRGDVASSYCQPSGGGGRRGRQAAVTFLPQAWAMAWGSLVYLWQ